MRIPFKYFSISREFPCTCFSLPKQCGKCKQQKITGVKDMNWYTSLACFQEPHHRRICLNKNLEAIPPLSKKTFIPLFLVQINHPMKDLWNMAVIKYSTHPFTTIVRPSSKFCQRTQLI